MEYMAIVTQIIAIIFLLISRLQKTKGKTLVFICFALLASMGTYFLLGQVAGACLLLAGILRSIVFFLYDHYKVKPNVIVLICFEISFIIILGLTWQSAIDIFILLSLVVFTFGCWQDNMYVFRILTITDHIVCIIYNSLVGAYITLVGEVFCLTATIISIVYYDIQKRTTPIIKRVFYCFKPKQKRKKLKARLRARRKI